jgi:hypothetical protein
MKTRNTVKTGDTITLTAVDRPAHLQCVSDPLGGVLLTSGSSTFGPYTHDTQWDQDGGVVTISRAIRESFNPASIPVGSSARIFSGEEAPVDFVAAVAADVVIASTGANNDLTFTAVVPGVAGDSLTVAIVQPETADEDLAVTYVAPNAVISLPTDGVGDPVAATAAQVKTAWDLSPALAVMTVAFEGTGAGNVETEAQTALTGGADQVDGTGYGVAGSGSIYTDTDTPGLYFNTGTADEPAWFEIATA